jgi:RNA polymerase sigma factor (sigma-70 family)
MAADNICQGGALTLVTAETLVADVAEDGMPGDPLTIAEQDRFIAAAFERDELRLRKFIRRRVLDAGDAEDVLQDVFYELVQAYRMMKPAEQMTAWLYRVARNRIVDLFRRRKTVSLNAPVGDEDGSEELEDLLPSADAGPDSLYARNVMLEAMDEALDELPEEQREVFVAHEFMGRSFKELSEETGVSVNTLLSRKRYAVLHLRERLREMGEEFGAK